MLVVAISLILPIFFFKFIKNRFIGYFVSSFCVSGIFIAYMVYLELTVPSGDMDFIFYAGLMLWMLIVFMYNGVVFTALSFIEDLLSSRNKMLKN